jgi:hypothetical protein
VEREYAKDRTGNEQIFNFGDYENLVLSSERASCEVSSILLCLVKRVSLMSVVWYSRWDNVRRYGK